MTIIKTASTTKVIGINIAKAAKPNAGTRASKICSEPYADEEMQSEERTPRADRLLRRWCPREWRFNGLPKRRRLILYESGSFRWAWSCSAIGAGAPSVHDFGTESLSNHRYS